MLQTLFSFFVLCISLKNASGEKFIINTDPGADDAVAIFTLLRYEASKPEKEFKIIAITCTYGNVEEKQAEINLLNILTLAGRKDIPVYGGAVKGFIEKFSSDYFYGRDGFGNMNLTDNNTIVQVDRSKHAAVALTELVKKTPGHISIINLGPTTNIALAISLDDTFLNHVHQIYQMGGAVKGTGNKNPNVEFNFAADPESNFLLLNSSRKSQITMHPWENTLNTFLSKEWRKNVLGKYDSPYIDFLNKVERVSLSSMVSYWGTSDALLAASIIEPKIVIKHETLNVYPVTHGEARGSVLVDYYRTTGRIENTNIVFESNATLFKEVLIRYLTCDEISC